MRKHKFVLVVLCVAVSWSTVQAQKADREGPLGLTWGSSADEVRALGAELQQDVPGTDYGMCFSAKKLPRVLSDQEETLVCFGYDDSLWRIVAYSKSFLNDPSGNNLKARYQKLLAILSEKYGSPSSVQTLGDSIYQQPQYFLAGIRAGLTYWYSNFSTPILSVQLNLSADDSSSGRWSIIYTNKSLRDAFDAAKKAKEKGSL